GRAVLFGGIGLMLAGVVLMGSAGGVGLLAAGAVISGVGNSVFHPADFSILNARVSPPRLGHAFGMHSISGSLGFAVAPLFSAAAAGFFGWHGAVYAAAVVGAAILALFIANSASF